MKKSISALLLSAIVGTSAAWAEHVAPERAAQIATNYVAAHGGASGLKVIGVEPLNDNLYLVSFADKGWAILSSDDCAEPVIAYSATGTLDLDKLPENMSYMLTEADASARIDIAAGTANRRWAQIERKQFSRAGEPVKPLIQVNWNQSDPWNKYCPGTGSNKAIVGCVAVSMAQAMSVQQYPMKPMGQVSYAPAGYGQVSIDYDKEANYDWAALTNKNSAKHKDEAARLMYHTGVSVRMGYGADGSGIPSNEIYRITNALTTNFGYPNVAYHHRDSYRGDWEQLLINELVAGRALVYNAIDTKGGYGHSFNIDGYDGDKMYHVNWGWGGYGDAYFNISALKDSQMNMNYDSDHRVVTGIGAANSPLQGIYVSDFEVEEDTPAGSGVAAVLVNGSLPTSAMKVEVTGEYNSSNDSFKDIPFTYKNGVLYTTRAISASEGTIYVRVKVTMKNESGKDINLIQGFNIAVTAPQPLERRTSLSYDRASKRFTLKSKFGATYTVTNSQGAVIATGTLDADPSVQFGRDQLTVGNNTIEVKCNGKSKQLTISL